MSETEKSKKKPAKRIIDVEQPGTSAPTATSKPVIVTNRPIMRDPMMVAEADDKPETEADSETPKVPADTLKTSDKQVLKPLDSVAGEADEKTDQPAADAKLGPADESDDHDSAPGPDTAQDDAQSGTDGIEPASLKSDNTNSAGEIPSPDTSKSGLAKQAEAEAAAKAKHDAEVQQLIDSEQYTLPIHTVEQRKSKRFVLLGIGLAIILILIWLDIALDAGIIKLGGLKPLTHFFSN